MVSTFEKNFCEANGRFEKKKRTKNTEPAETTREHKMFYKPEDILGEWKGFLQLGEASYRLVMKVKLDDDQLMIYIDNMDTGDIGIRVTNIQFDGVNLAGTLAVDGSTLSGEFLGDELLMGQVTYEGMQIPLELRRDHPAFVQFDTPRLNSDGLPVKQYTYQVPASLDDGWQVGALQDEGIEKAPIVALMNAILEGDYPQTHSVLVARNGRLLLEEYYYGHERDKIHGIQSVTKSITSILIGIAIDRGEIESIEQQVHTFFPERTGFRWVDERYNLTLKNILTMSAGLDWEETVPYTDPKNDNTAMNRSGDWVGYVLNKQVRGRPGEKYSYTSGLSILLGALLKNATGLYPDEYAEKHLFSPLGITAYDWYKAPDGTRHTGGGLLLRSRDLAKLGEMLRLNGSWNGKCIVSEVWVHESTRQQTAVDDYAYGYQWHIRRFDLVQGRVEAYCGMGYGGQFLFVFPELGLVVQFNAGMYGGDPKPIEKLEKYILPAVH